MLTREDVDKQAWIGEQRAAVMELVEAVEAFQTQQAALQGDGIFLEMGKAIGRFMNASRRCELAVYLCEGTSMKVTLR